MNCDAARDDILLELSGELAAAHRADLQAHLAACAACSAYRRDATRMLGVVKRVLTDGEPQRATLDRIAGEASRLSRRHRSVVLLRPVWLAAAAAAVVMLAFSAYVVGPRRGRSSDAARVAERRITEMGALAACLAEDDDVVVEADYQAKPGDERRALARQLLRMQGLGADDRYADEEAISAWEPDSTDLQSRSASSLPLVESA